MSELEDATNTFHRITNSLWVIEYMANVPDLQFPEATWWAYGLPNSNEIAVVVRVGSVRLALASKSQRTHPIMFSPMRQMDEQDIKLTLDLQQRLWRENFERIALEVAKLRSHEKNRNLH
jgi:hypothetical protein